ncbi:MAG: hypothetical protein APR54_02310 [Candidatus Cloacimonas sp. SDB]|nr:MAG: hypothetical protein APR54_02310 [Candidatus Cloacimonas sp. SDB]
MKYILVVLVLINYILLTASDLSFYREELSFEVKADTFSVDGVYYFRNSSRQTITRTIFYPLPQREDLLTIDSFLVHNLTANAEIEISQHNLKGISFPIKIPAGDSLAVRVCYSQLMKENSAEYIFTSTSSWNIPLEKADFQLILPAELELASVNFAIDEVRVENGTTTFFWQRRNFFPARNLLMKFKLATVDN